MNNSSTCDFYQVDNCTGQPMTQAKQVMCKQSDTYQKTYKCNCRENIKQLYGGGSHLPASPAKIPTDFFNPNNCYLRFGSDLIQKPDSETLVNLPYMDACHDVYQINSGYGQVHNRRQVGGEFNYGQVHNYQQVGKGAVGAPLYMTSPDYSNLVAPKRGKSFKKLKYNFNPGGNIRFLPIQ